MYCIYNIDFDLLSSHYLTTIKQTTFTVCQLKFVLVIEFHVMSATVKQMFGYKINFGGQISVIKVSVCECKGIQNVLT